MAASPWRRPALRALLSLPSPVLRALAGGGVAYMGGRTLDPRMQYLASLAARSPPGAQASPDRGPPIPSGVRVEDIRSFVGGGDLVGRIFTPAEQNPAAPPLVFATGAAGLTPYLDSGGALCGLIAQAAGCPVVAVDPRSAPEHRFPVGRDDVLAAYRWARDRAGLIGAPAGRAAIGGASLGGALAAGAAEALKAAGEAPPLLQVLVAPALDLANEAPSMSAFATAYPLSAAGLAAQLGRYLGPETSPIDPQVSPARAPDLAGSPPTILIGAGFDPLADQGEAYARALMRAGTRVTYRRHDALTHAFWAFADLVPAADLACREIARLVAEAYVREPA